MSDGELDPLTARARGVRHYLWDQVCFSPLLLSEPPRLKQRHFDPACRVGTDNGAGPDPGNRNLSVHGRVVASNALDRFVANPFTIGAYVQRKALVAGP